MMRPPRVLLADALDGPHEARLAAGATVTRPASAALADLRAAIIDCDALIVRTHTPVPRALIAAAPRLRVIGVAGVGTDRIDVAAAEQHGVTVLTSGAAADAVAEFTIALLLQLLRPIPHMAAQLAAGAFAAARAVPHGRELASMTVGIVGMGRIGSRVGRICAAGFGARVIYHDIAPVGPFPFAAAAVAPDVLWRTADAVCLHVPLTPATAGMVHAARLALLKPAALLVNAARGAIVDTAALTAALQEGRLGGAALDVTEPEPLPREHPLLHMPNCIVTPHVAARTHAGLAGMLDIVDDVLAVLAAR